MNADADPAPNSHETESPLPLAPCADITDLLACCLTNPEDRAWRQLTQIIQALAGRRFRSLRPTDVDLFQAWILGWPRLRPTLGCAYKKLREWSAQNPEPSERERQHFFINYYMRAVHSALIDFFSEQQPDTLEVPPAIDEQPASPTLCDDSPPRVIAREVFLEDWSRTPFSDPDTPCDAQIRAEASSPGLDALAALDPAYRVPFKLTHLPDCLDDADYAWLAELTSRAPAELRATIEDEQLRNHTKKYPLSGAFIAAMLGLTPATVSQRVRRALRMLKASL